MLTIKSQKHDDETIREYIARIMNHLNFEFESFLDVLPSVQSVVHYFELMIGSYDVEFMHTVFDEIDRGADPQPLADFIYHYKIPLNNEAWILTPKS